MKNYLITGIAGTGKSTIGEVLVRKGYRVIEFDGFPSDGVILRKYGTKFDRRTNQPSGYKRGDGWEELQYVNWRIDREQLLPDLQGPSGLVQFICGYADNWEEFRNDFDKIFLLEVDPATVAKRLLSRSSGDWGRKYPEGLKHATQKAKEFNNSLVRLGATSINADANVDEIVAIILKSIEL